MSKKVLVVDDSIVVRNHLARIISEAGHIVETAKNGIEACDKAIANKYDAITMDVNMPMMDGLAAVKKIMQNNPTPIIMLSALTKEDADITFDALDLGAVAAIEKTNTMHVGGAEKQHSILKTLEEAFSVSMHSLKLGTVKRGHSVQETTQINSTDLADSIVLIGSSTGGPRLIEEICYALPKDYPHAVCVAQHMPTSFIERFAQRLNENSKIQVVLSQENMEVKKSTVYIAKGGTHLKFARSGGKIVLKHGDSRRKCFFVPSVDEMYFSAAEAFNPAKIFAVQLTGIGDDGADGMVLLKQKGAYTIAESQETATVFGMPKEAAARGGTKEVLPFPKIVQRIISHG
ncbi:MAG: chemotaxis-specific protein-glutamate methyltransferase CheB [Helicobacteraceae bacterium]